MSELRAQTLYMRDRTDQIEQAKGPKLVATIMCYSFEHKLAFKTHHQV
jgi:hypothetical protein